MGCHFKNNVQEQLTRVSLIVALIKAAENSKMETLLKYALLATELGLPQTKCEGEGGDLPRSRREGWYGAIEFKERAS